MAVRDKSSPVRRFRRLMGVGRGRKQRGAKERSTLKQLLRERVATRLSPVIDPNSLPARGKIAVSFSPRPDLPQGGLGSFSVAVGRSTPVISATETSPLVPVGRSTPVISGSQGTPEEIPQVSAGRSTPAIAEARESTSQSIVRSSRPAPSGYFWVVQFCFPGHPGSCRPEPSGRSKLTWGDGQPSCPGFCRPEPSGRSSFRGHIGRSGRTGCGRPAPSG